MVVILSLTALISYINGSNCVSLHIEGLPALVFSVIVFLNNLF